MWDRIHYVNDGKEKMKAHFSCVLAYTAVTHHIILTDGFSDSDSALGTEVKAQGKWMKEIGCV